MQPAQPSITQQPRFASLQDIVEARKAVAPDKLRQIGERVFMEEGPHKAYIRDILEILVHSAINKNFPVQFSLDQLLNSANVTCSLIETNKLVASLDDIIKLRIGLTLTNSEYTLSAQGAGSMQRTFGFTPNVLL
jgi:hypothetical protein